MVYYKNNKGKFFGIEEDLSASTNSIFIDEAKEEGVHLDFDTSWHYHIYDAKFLKTMTLSQIKDIFRNFKQDDDELKNFINSTLLELDTDDEEEIINEIIFEIENSKQYSFVSHVYMAVNESKNNKIHAFELSGYSQGEMTFVWFEDDEEETMSGRYGIEYLSNILYDNFMEIFEVDKNGRMLDTLDIVVSVGNDEFDEYMKEHYDAEPANEETTLTLS